GGLALEAVCARVVHALGAHGLGRFARVEDRPGLPRALARTLSEVRMSGLTSTRLRDDDLARVAEAYEQMLSAAGLADRALLMTMALDEIERAPAIPVGLPLLVFDLCVHSALERRLLAALARRSSAALVTLPSGDERTLAAACEALGVPPAAV